MGGGRRTQREPRETQGEHANSTQEVKPFTFFFSLGGAGTNHCTYKKNPKTNSDCKEHDVLDKEAAREREELVSFHLFLANRH